MLRVDVRQQRDASAVGAGLERRLGRREGAASRQAGIGREGGGAVQQLGPGREPAPVLRPLGGAFQLRRDHLVRAGGGVGEVADMAILVDVGCDHLGENVVHPSPIDGGRRAVDRGPHQGWRKTTRPRSATTRARSAGSAASDARPSLAAAAGDGREVARGLGRREQQPSLRGLGQALDEGDVVILHAATDRQGFGQRLAPVELSNRQRGTQVTKCEWVPGRGLEHPVGHPSVDRAAHHHAEQLERILIRKVDNLDRRQPVER